MIPSHCPIDGYPCYRVTIAGEVQSCAPLFGIVSGEPVWRTLKPYLQRCGHLRVMLHNADGRKKFFVHSLVLSAYVGPRPPGMQCRHLDGDSTNNRLDNLAWGTPAENSGDRVRHGTQVRGSRHPCSKLSEDEVREIAKLLSESIPKRHLARRFGISRGVIRQIALGLRWTHITRPVLAEAR